MVLLIVPANLVLINVRHIFCPNMVRHGTMREETVLRCQGNVRRHHRVVAGDCCADFDRGFVCGLDSRLDTVVYIIDLW